MNDTCSVQLPADLLARLRTRKKIKGYSYTAIDRDAARFFGIKPNSICGTTWWNETIDALDLLEPNWRGFPAPETNMAMTKVLVDRSARDAS